MMFSQRFLFTFVFSVAAASICAFGDKSVRVWQEPLTLPTYRVGADDKNPIFRRPLSYQGAHRVLYPYPAQDNFTGIKEDRTYQALYLENEYIKLCVLPEMGGRLFYATDKTNGYEIFYRQNVIKPAHIGMLGAWISGGIEWCVFHHHRASTFMPVDYKLIENPDGSGTIWIGEIEPRHRMRWSIGITLYPGKSWIEADIRMFNRTAMEHSLLYWANVATHANDAYQVIFPPSTKYGVYHAKTDFMHWPVGRGMYRNVDYTGVDASWWKNHPRPVSIFAHDLAEGFLAGYDHEKDAGTMYVANHHIAPGAKLWEWGPSEQGSMWDTKVLTDSDGPYAELMTGAYSDNQPDYSWIAPYEFKQAKQYWYPLRNIGGAKSANRQAAVNLEVRDGTIALAFNVTERRDDAEVTLTAKGTPLLKKVVSISPENPFAHSLSMPEGVKESDLSALLRAKDGRVLIRYQPVVLDVGDELPETVRPPAEPEDIKTVEELYLTGLRIKQFYNARLNPNDYFREALKRDPGDSRSNIQLGLDAVQRGLYAQAEAYFQAAVRRIAKDYTRPRDCEAYYQLGRVLKKQGRPDEAVDALYRAAWDYAFRSAAYFHLAEIETQRGNFEKALGLVDESLVTNAVSLRALGLKSALLRRLGRPESALEAAARSLAVDPLDYLARNERAAALRLLPDAQAAAQEMRELDRIMNDDPESYLELAADYLSAGLYDEAIDVLTRTLKKTSPRISRYPTIHYYLAYLWNMKNDAARSRSFLESAARCPTDYCFPFRMETLDVLEYAIAVNPDDARAYYYKGNLLYDHQPDKAIEAWETAVRLEPELAIAHRNLGWGYYDTRDDIERAIAAYRQAIRHNNQDPRYYYELDILCERNGTPVEQRLDLFERNRQVVLRHNLSLVRKIITLVQAGRYDRAIRFLTDHQFPAQEGTRRLHDVHVDAHLLRGLERLGQAEYALALEDFLAADDYPENHQVGRNPNYARNPQIYYLTGICRLKAGDAEGANREFEKAMRGVLDDDDDEDRRVQSVAYYQAMAMRTLGRDKQADELLERLVRQGARQLERVSDVDFFAKFGQGDPPHVRRAQAYYMQGLGYLGQGRHEEARQALVNAVELDVNHIWAKYYLVHKLKDNQTP